MVPYRSHLDGGFLESRVHFALAVAHSRHARLLRRVAVSAIAGGLGSIFTKQEEEEKRKITNEPNQ